MIPVWRIYEAAYHGPLLGHVRAADFEAALLEGARRWPHAATGEIGPNRGSTSRESPW